MLGLINAVTATFGAIDRYVKEGLVMANRFLTPPKLSHPAQGSAEFNGSSDYIDTNAQLIQNTHSVSAWVYFEGTSNGQVVCSRDAGQDGLYLLMTASQYPYYRVNNSTITTSTAYSDEWVHLGATYDGTTQKLYINGSQVGNATTSQTISVGNNTTIGKSSFADSEYFDGNLANVAIWNRALSSDEINAVMWKGYQSLTDNEKSGLKAWYSLDDVASPAASLATMEALAVDKDATIENKAAVTAAINSLS